MNNIAFDYNYQDNILDINFKPLSKEVGSFYEECLNTARYIRASTDKPIIVCLSGGIDSEIICRSFMAAGIDFSVITARHKNYTNTFDINYAIRFCKEYNIPMNIIELDIEDYFTNGIEKHISEGYKAINIYRYFLLFMLDTVDKMGGCAVMGDGPQVYYTINDEICIKYDAGMLAPLEWCKNNNACHFPIFFQTTPEIMYAYQKHPLIAWLLNDPSYYTMLDARYTAEKTLVYHQCFSGMEHRTKFNGYELIRKFRDSVQLKLEERFPNINYVYIPVSRIQDQFKQRIV
jgi:asparagine synthetase B (glutamine-hydrolysing)